MKIRLGLAGDALFRQFSRFSSPDNDETWADTCFYRPAHDFIWRLDPTLLVLDDIRIFTSRLRDAIFSELTVRWKACDHAPICHAIHPTWSHIVWPRRIFSRATCSSYHQIAVGRGKLGDRRKYSKTSGSSDCRFGCKAEETVYHLFFSCPFCHDDVDALHKICRERRIDYTIPTLFRNEHLQGRVELFLRRIFSF